MKVLRKKKRVGWVTAGVLAGVVAALATLVIVPAGSAGRTASRVLAFSRAGSLYLVREDGTGLRRLTKPGVRVGGFDWSPDGRRLVFAQAGAGLIVVDVATGKQRSLAVAGFDPDWSPDGRRIAFTRGDNAEIRIISAAGGPAHLLVSEYDASLPRWSPDSRRLVFSWDGGDTFNAFAVIDADGSHRIDIGSDGDNVSSPIWSADGLQIAFLRYRQPPGGEGTIALYVMNSDGTDQRRFLPATTPPEVQASPAWSPDGRRIAFVASRPGGPELGVMDADGTNRTMLAANASQPQWSDDGTRIAFARPRGRNTDTYIISADGHNEHRIAKGRINHFAWRP